MKFLLKAVSNVDIIVIFVPKIILMALIVSDAITYQKKISCDNILKICIFPEYILLFVCIFPNILSISGN